MNDRSEPGRSIPGEKAGSHLQDTGNDAGSYLDGRDYEAPCPRFRPFSSMTIGERQTEAENDPHQNGPKAIGGGDWSP
jgi:hypothetical protein